MVLNASEVIYEINHRNELVRLNSAWDQFATDNGSPELIRERVTHKPLLTFIHDAETRHIHEILLERVRAGRQIKALPFRCDSPELRRFMEMDIIAHENGHVLYRCRTLRTEIREPIMSVSVLRRSGDGIMRVCSWCKKVGVDNACWVEIEDAIRLMRLDSDALAPRITHTICDSCMARLEAET